MTVQTIKFVPEIFIRTQFAHVHRWPNAPKHGSLANLVIGFLSEPHRHMFHVRISVSVSGLDREIEFLDFKQYVDNYIESQINAGWHTASCEQMAASIAMYLVNNNIPVASVEVSEDGENGAIVKRSTDG